MKPLTTWQIAKGVFVGQALLGLTSFLLLDVFHYLMTGH